jgi:hypothetical protein
LIKRVLGSGAVAVAAILLVAGFAGAAGGKLKCFTADPGACSVSDATNSATLDTTNGGVAGVYYTNGKSLGGSSLDSVDFSFDYRCQPTNVDTTSCTGGGAPRWSIPIDTGGDSKDAKQVYAFVDAANCGYRGTVSTEDANCPVYLNTGGTWPNWDAFAAANPTYSIASAYPFVISDVQTGGQIILYDVTEG